MDVRIGIVGCAGTGKSSLARKVAEELKAPLLESKRITQDILERDGYDYSSGVQIERFLANTGRQNEILRRTMEQEQADTFITDRTLVDLAAYVVCEMHDSDTKVVSDIFNTCQERAGRYTHLFLCPWRNERAGENQKRTLNPWYQFKIHAMEVGILAQWGYPYVILEPYETEERVRLIVEQVLTSA